MLTLYILPSILNHRRYLSIVFAFGNKFYLIWFIAVQLLSTNIITILESTPWSIPSVNDIISSEQ